MLEHFTHTRKMTETDSKNTDLDLLRVQSKVTIGYFLDPHLFVESMSYPRPDRVSKNTQNILCILVIFENFN